MPTPQQTIWGKEKDSQLNKFSENGIRIGHFAARKVLVVEGKKVVTNHIDQVIVAGPT